MSTREADVLRDVKDFLAQTGRFFLRLNSGKVKVRGGWMQLCPEGTPDVQVITSYYEGEWQRVTWIETKLPKGKQSDAQVEFQKAAERRGETYILARSVEDVIKGL